MPQRAKKCTMEEKKTEQKAMHLQKNSHVLKINRRTFSEREPPDRCCVTDSIEEQPEELLTGKTEEFLPGMKGEFLPGMKEEFLPGMKEEFLPGMKEEFLPGMKEEFLPEITKELLPEPPAEPPAEALADRKTGVLVEIRRVLSSEPLRKINCLTNVDDILCFSQYSKESECFNQYSKESKFSCDILNEGTSSERSYKLEKDLQVYEHLATLYDDDSFVKEEERIEVEEVKAAGTFEVEANTVDNTPTDDVEEPYPIEQESTKSCDDDHELSFDNMNEGVLDYVKEKRETRGGNQIRYSRKGPVDTGQCYRGEFSQGYLNPCEEAYEEGQSRKETDDKDIADKNVIDKNVIDKNVIDKNVIDKNAIDKNVIDKNVIDKNLIDKNLTDKNMIDKNLTDKNMIDKNLIDKNLTDKNLTDKNLTDKNLIDKNVEGKEDLVKEGTTSETEPFPNEENYAYKVPGKSGLDIIVRSSIKTYSCALKKKMLLQGKIFITHDSVYFMSLFDSLFSKNSILRIPYESIESVKKMSVFNFIPNALKIVAKNRSFVFTSFVHRDNAYDLIMDMIQDNMNADEIPKKGVVIHSSEELDGEEAEEEEAEAEEGDDMDDADDADDVDDVDDVDDESDQVGENEGSEKIRNANPYEEKEKNEEVEMGRLKDPNRPNKRKLKKRLRIRNKMKNRKKQNNKSVIYNITPTQYDPLVNTQFSQVVQQDEGVEGQGMEGEDSARVSTASKDVKEKILMIETRKGLTELNITEEEEELLNKHNYVRCNYHTDSLYVNKNFKKIFVDIFSKFDCDNPIVKSMQDKNPNNLSYEHLYNLNKELDGKGHLSYESIYNISLFDDGKRVFGMPSRSDVKENLSFFFFKNIISIQKSVSLLCNIPLAGCFRTVVTVTLHNVHEKKNEENQADGINCEGGNPSGSDDLLNSCTHVDFSYDIEFVKHTFFKKQIKNNALLELEISLNTLKKYTQEAIQNKYKQKSTINKKNQTQPSECTFVKDYIDIVTIGEDKILENSNISTPTGISYHVNDNYASTLFLHNAVKSFSKRMRMFHRMGNLLSRPLDAVVLVRSFLVFIFAAVIYILFELMKQ
ncbi:hypothetical protein, conserved [Plasmodium gonderi]|uniref:GRAM domain-containing protein n=1 Tax=Plasmodium gonderi TaxID=77519 RepID=A0A1Y1JBD9_PLAGO|nr:hypothetical protein, conserved [Plasmodium gonderi]GAW78998.1 hypothetical protein, conserved [Plasmodium gonderi]